MPIPAGQEWSLQDVLNQMVALNATVVTLQHEIAQLKEERSRMDTSGSERVSKGGMYDKRNWEPDKLSKIIDFREWSEDFWEYIDQCD